MTERPSKYHHRIPQTYMKPWCFGKQTIHTFIKESESFEDRNIEKIMGLNYYHSVKAGSLYYTEESLERIFGILDSYIIKYQDETLNDYELYNRYFYAFDSWELLHGNGNELSRKERNKLKSALQEASDDSLEKKFNQIFENNWFNLTNDLYIRLKNINRNCNPKMISEEEYDQFIKYFIMYEWRSKLGNAQLNEMFNVFETFIPSIDIPLSERTFKYDETSFDEIKHAILLHHFEELLEDKGMMHKIFEIYKSTMTLAFILNPRENFITSDNPCYICDNIDGTKSPILVISPSVLLVLVRKPLDWNGEFCIKDASKEDVEYYNKKTFENGNIILFKEKDNIPST